jgi:integrase
MAIKFEDRALRSLRPADGQDRGEWADALVPGLRFRVSLGGRGSFSVVYRVRGCSKQDRETIGPYPRISLAEARKQAREVLNAAARGEDPKVSRRPRPKTLTVRELFVLYMERVVSKKHRRPEHVRQKLEKDLLPAIGELSVGDVTRQHILDIADDIEGRGAPVTATNVLDMASGMFKWAIGRNLMANNPCYLVPRPGRVQPGTRVLSDDEIRALWAYLTSGSNRQEEASRLVLMSRLLLGQRTSELVRMERAQWEQESGVPMWWNLPARITKNKRAHRVPLPSLWREHVFPGIQELGEGTFAFPSPRNANRHVAEGTVSLCCQRLARPEKIGFHFAARDLRRTYITRLARLGVAREVRRRLVNHSETGVDAVHYNLYDYDAEMFTAVAIFNAHLQRLLFGEGGELATVVPIRV